MQVIWRRRLLYHFIRVNEAEDDKRRPKAPPLTPRVTIPKIQPLASTMWKVRVKDIIGKREAKGKSSRKKGENTGEETESMHEESGDCVTEEAEPRIAKVSTSEGAESSKEESPHFQRKVTNSCTVEAGLLLTPKQEVVSDGEAGDTNCSASLLKKQIFSDSSGTLLLKKKPAEDDFSSSLRKRRLAESASASSLRKRKLSEDVDGIQLVAALADTDDLLLDTENLLLGTDALNKKIKTETEDLGLNQQVNKEKN